MTESEHKVDEVLFLYEEKIYRDVFIPKICTGKCVSPAIAKSKVVVRYGDGYGEPPLYRDVYEHHIAAVNVCPEWLNIRCIEAMAIQMGGTLRTLYDSWSKFVDIRKSIGPLFYFKESLYPNYRVKEIANEEGGPLQWKTLSWVDPVLVLEMLKDWLDSNPVNPRRKCLEDVGLINKSYAYTSGKGYSRAASYEKSGEFWDGVSTRTIAYAERELTFKGKVCDLDESEIPLDNLDGSGPPDMKMLRRKKMAQAHAQFCEEQGLDKFEAAPKPDFSWVNNTVWLRSNGEFKEYPR